ncbi:MAG: methyltransferase domain-containing protein [Acidobacteriaceae bacterium]|nr:methyltransferase domain-containing protein [Acidobacteriaceae bacterium]
MKRVCVPEFLDSDAGTAGEVHTALVDLRRINRWFGGTSTTLALLERVLDCTKKHDLSFLEVASGTAEVPEIAAGTASKRGVVLRTFRLDRAASHLTNGNGKPHDAVVADALHLPFADRSIDLVSCGLFAHHLDPDQLMQFAQEALRVARVALLVNDLVRNPAHWAAAWIGRPLWRSRLTRHDSVVSVRRSYTPEELRALLQQAGAPGVEISRHYFFRMGAIVWMTS